MAAAPLDRRLAIAFATLLGLGGCASNETHDLLFKPPAVYRADVASMESIYVATTRKAADDPLAVYGGRRAADPGFARIDISVPLTHQIGKVERPKSAKADPARYFTAQSVKPIAGLDAFAKEVGADARAEGGRALVFVHGYNTDFDDAVYRLTQISKDSGYPGAPVLFSWASGGRTIDYVYDRDSANAARDELEATLKALSRSGLKRIDIVAHSMGTWLAMEVLRSLAIENDRDLGGKLGDVVLASPDIDVDVFKAQMRRYGTPKRPFIVMLSSDDRALRLSSLIAGRQPRLGGYKNAAELAALGVVVVDLSAIKSGDDYNHTKFADNPALVKLLGEGLRRDDNLTESNDLGDGLSVLAKGVTSAAQIVVTTPVQVINIAVGE